MNLATHSQPRGHERFSHEVTFYEGPSDLARTVAPYVLEGVDNGEAVLVAMVPRRAEALERALGSASAAVEWVDMDELGRNPARIIPAWRRFVEEHRDLGPMRGVGEPAWPGRRAVEMDEADLHESLLNLAFDDGPPWRLLCPYDVTALPDEVVAGVARTHPVVHENGPEGYAGHGYAQDRFASSLAAVPADALVLPFDASDLPGVRGLIRRVGQSSRLGADASENLVLAAHELAMNSVLHGDGRGTVSVWHTDEALVVEIADSGLVADPLIGRTLVDPLAESGRGVWLANQLCDLVQVRSGEFGTQIRLWTWN